MSYGSKAAGDSSRRSVTLVLALLAIIAVVGAFHWLKERNTPLPTTAKLVVLSGEATVMRADAGIDPPLRQGKTTEMQRGDEVRTGADSRAKLTFGGGETTELGAETFLTILELYQSPISRALVVLLDLHEGFTLTRIRHALFQGMRFEIETRVATVKVQGTVFQCDALDNHHIYVAVYDGVVNVSMGEQSVDLEAGQGMDIRLGQPLVPVAASQSVPLETLQTVQTTPSLVSAPATLTSQEKTLFPPVVTPTRPGDEFQVYVVKEGDTLHSISRQVGVSWKTIWEINKDVLASPELIRAGQKLRIPRR